MHLINRSTLFILGTFVINGCSASSSTSTSSFATSLSSSASIASTKKLRGQSGGGVLNNKNQRALIDCSIHDGVRACSNAGCTYNKKSKVCEGLPWSTDSPTTSDPTDTPTTSPAPTTSWMPSSTCAADGDECGDSSLGLCQRSQCLNGECQNTELANPSPKSLCMCGYCAECTEDSEFCGGNCQFAIGNDDPVARPPSSLLLSVPCEYDSLVLAVANCQPKKYYRDVNGYFNISKTLGTGECGNDNSGLQASVGFLGSDSTIESEVVVPYGTLTGGAYSESFTGPTIEFTKPDGYFEIHTSCSYELYLGQTFGPRSEIIVSGYCLSNNLGGQFAECSYSDLPVPETHQCEGGPTTSPTISSSPTKAPISSSPTIEPEQNCAKSGEDCKSQACCSDSVCVKNKGVSTCVSA